MNNYKIKRHIDNWIEQKKKTKRAYSWITYKINKSAIAPDAIANISKPQQNHLIHLLFPQNNHIEPTT